MTTKKLYKAVCSDCATNPADDGYVPLAWYTVGFSGTAVLETSSTRQFYVVNMSSWRGRVSASGLYARMLSDHIYTDEADQILADALDQTAEKFDTLEQAMLYYHLVK